MYKETLSRRIIEYFKKTRKEDFGQTFRIITDSFKKIRNFDIIKEILENKNYYGFSLVILDNKLTNLPSAKTIISLTSFSLLTILKSIKG